MTNSEATFHPVLGWHKDHNAYGASRPGNVFLEDFPCIVVVSWQLQNLVRQIKAICCLFSSMWKGFVFICPPCIVIGDMVRQIQDQELGYWDKPLKNRVCVIDAESVFGWKWKLWYIWEWRRGIFAVRFSAAHCVAVLATCVSVKGSLLFHIL